MIKPVYFGKKDGILIEHISKINFSEWVRKKLREEIGVGIVGSKRVEIDLDNENIEMLVRKIIKEEMICDVKATGDEKVNIETEIEDIDVGNVEIISGWTL